MTGKPGRTLLLPILLFLSCLALFPEEGSGLPEDRAPRRNLREEAPVGEYPESRNHAGPVLHSLPVPETPLLERYLRQYTSPSHRPWLEGIRERSRTYMDFILATAEELEVPWELAYLPAVESAFLPYAVSRSGAAGLWQFMTNSISPYDMRVDEWRDDRRDFRKATRGALEKLKYNRQVLGDWYLALAAYNCGLGRVQRTMASSGIRDYWELSEKGLLPRETIQYVPKFLALAHILGYPGRWNLPLDWELPPVWEAIPLTQALDLRILAAESGVPLEVLTGGNAELRYMITPPESAKYELKVPAGYTDSIREVLARPGGRLIRFYIYRIGPGDTFYALSRHYGVSVGMIQKYNPGLNPSLLRIGQQVVIPALKEVEPYQGRAAQEPRETVLPSEFRGVYAVVPGDSLWSISRKYGITPEELARNNGLSLNGILPAGRVLQVPGEEVRIE